MMRTDVNH